MLKHLEKGCESFDQNLEIRYYITMNVGENYIDGGVGGNCPLAQAIPRMREITNFGSPNSVLSIAPPRYILGKRN